MVSMGGLEPPRISPHAPQTCAYTDSATSTQTIQLSLRDAYTSPLLGRYLIFLVGRVPHRHSYLIFKIGRNWYISIYVSRHFRIDSTPPLRTILNRSCGVLATPTSFLLIFQYTYVIINFFSLQTFILY